MKIPLIESDVDISVLLKTTPSSVANEKEDLMGQITDNYLSRLLSIPLDVIDKLSMDFRNLVTNRIEKAK